MQHADVFAKNSNVPVMTTSAKVRFNLDSGDWHGHGSEMLWATPIAETEWRSLKIMNSPFFTRGISYLHVVAATSEGDMIFRFNKVEKRSGSPFPAE